MSGGPEHRAFVAGATGYTGRAVVAALRRRGIETLALEMDLARQRMEVNVNPRLMLETVLARTARELR